MELFKLLGTIAVNNAEANKALDETSGKGEKAESKLSKAFGAMGKGAAIAGKAIATGLAAGATAMAGLTVKALNAAGDLEQNMGGAEAVFGELGKTIGDMKTPMQVFNSETGKVETQMSSLETVSKEAYKNMGLSQTEYLATANKMGALFKGAGFETQEALDLSSQAMQRAADVASIMGIDTSAAMEAVAGAAKGNFTMMDNLGVAMNDTAIAAYAMEKGINKSTSEMSQQEKIGLAMEMFLDKTSYAAGNYAKENETLAGSLGTAKAAFTNFLAGSGDVDSLVSSFSNLANVVVRSLEEIAPRLTTGIADLVAKVAPLIAPLLNTLLPVLVEGAVSLVNGLVAALPGIITAILDIIPALIDGILQIADALVGALPQIIQAIVNALPTLIPALIDGVVSLVMMLVEMLPQIIDPLIAALPTIIISIVEALVNNLPAIIQGLISLIMGIVTALPQIIQALVDALPTVISLLVQAVLNNLPAIIMGLIQVVFGIVAALPQILGSLISAIPAALSGIWDGIGAVFGNLGSWFGEKFSAAKDAAVNAWSDAKEKWNGIKDKCVEGFSNLKDKVGTKFNEAKTAAQQKWADAKTKWSGVKDKVVEGFSNLKDKVGTKFSEAKTKAQEKWNDAKSKFSSVKDKVVSAFSDLGSKVSPLFSKAKDNATNTWSNVKSIFNKFKNGDIVGAFKDLGSLLKAKFSSALNAAKQGFSKIAQIGKDLVTGLWKGINDKFGWLTSQIKSFTKGVTDKLKSFFGIKSPARSTAEMGKYLAEGLAVGITKNSEEAENSAEKMAKNVLDAAQKRLDDYKTYNELTLADEVAFWNSVRQQVKEGTDARISADQKYLEAKKSLNEGVLDAETTLQEKLNEIGQKIVDRQKSIMDSFDLFKEFEVDEVVKPYEMIDILDTQVDALEQYQGIMSSLKDKIGDTALYAELESMGIGALNKAGAINAMSDYQLQNYVQKFEQMSNLAKDIAKDQLAEETLAETTKAIDGFGDSFNALGIEIIDGAKALGLTVEGMLAQMKAAFESFDPEMKMPHFEILGSFDIETNQVPTVVVDWYDKAMNHARILDKPTIFGYDAATGKYLGGGESGSEVVAGSQTLMNMIQAAVSEQNSKLTYYMQKIIEILANYFPQLLEGLDRPISFDPVAGANAMAIPMNDALGRLTSRKDRGR